jgi:hypothetical protein
MEITVKIIKENKDGSADAQVRFDKEGLETLVQWGLVAMLVKAVDEYATEEQKAARGSKAGNSKVPRLKAKSVEKKKK